MEQQASKGEGVENTGLGGTSGSHHCAVPLAKALASPPGIPGLPSRQCSPAGLVPGLGVPEHPLAQQRPSRSVL